MAKDTELDFGSENIFDEFSEESKKLSEEVQKQEQKQPHDLFFYLKRVSSTLFIFNVVLLLVVCILGTYSYIQSQEVKRAYSFLTPICQLFLGEAASNYSTCYAVQSVLPDQQQLLKDLRNKQSEQVIQLLGNMYDIRNFNLSRKVLFLLDKTENRSEPLTVLSAFDELKNKYAPVDKSEITCYNIEIYDDRTLDVTCDAYASDWDAKIVDVKDGVIQSISGGGTSVSRASSFINFLETYPGTYFTIESKPEEFVSTEVRQGPYTNKTTIQLRMKYIGGYTPTL